MVGAVDVRVMGIFPPTMPSSLAMRGIGGSQLSLLAVPAAGLAVVLGAFEVASRTDVLPRSSFPPVSEIFVKLADIAVTGEYGTAVVQTLHGWALAMLLACAIGLPLGLAVGATRLGFLLTRVTVDFLRPIPSVALIPLLVLIYGTRPPLKIALATFGATFPLLFQAMYGVRDVDPVARDTARAYGLGPVQRVWRVVLPSCLPYLVTGLRIASSIALILVVTGEYVVGVEGLGQEVLVAQSGGAYDQMYAYVITAGLLGLALNGLFQVAERYVLFWHPSQRAAAT
jgi:ABC-type nitrate/sulfonate/bicarbonate transport system permease component